MNDEFYLDGRELSKERDALDEHEEESYCNWEIGRNPDILTSSPDLHSYVAPVPYSEDLAKELQDRDREFELKKHSRSDILKLLRE